MPHVKLIYKWRGMHSERFFFYLWPMNERLTSSIEWRKWRRPGGPVLSDPSRSIPMCPGAFSSKLLTMPFFFVVGPISNEGFVSIPFFPDSLAGFFDIWCGSSALLCFFGRLSAVLGRILPVGSIGAKLMKQIPSSRTSDRQMTQSPLGARKHPTFWFALHFGGVFEGEKHKSEREKGGAGGRGGKNHWLTMKSRKRGDKVVFSGTLPWQPAIMEPPGSGCLTPSELR